MEKGLFDIMKNGTFKDGIKSMYNSLANRRSATSSNFVYSPRIGFDQLNEVYKTGLGNKIVRIKSGYALKSSAMIFDNSDDKKFYITKLQAKVKEAFRWSLIFGRGIIVIKENGDLREPLIKNLNRDNLAIEVFSGDIVSVESYETDLLSDRYNKPDYYSVRGVSFHHSRVIDFTYIKPTETDLPKYNWGGISEFELIYNQVIDDGVIGRASATIIEKNSSFFYKIDGLKQAIANKRYESIVKFYEMAEDRRSIYGAGLIDSNDDVVSVSQNLSNLSEADTISIRRVAMVSSIPVSVLIGESVRGLNSSGEQEKTIFNEANELLQQDYVLPFLNQLMYKIGLSPIAFKENQNVTPREKADYETKVIDNAFKIFNMGYDVDNFLKERGVEVHVKNEFDEFDDDDDDEVVV